MRPGQCPPARQIQPRNEEDLARARAERPPCGVSGEKKAVGRSLS